MMINLLTRFVPIITVFLVLFSACNKGSGPGGRASIKGKIFAKNLTSNLSVINDSGFVGDHQVYLSYGDNLSVSEKVETSYTGDFEFLYLRPGKYTLYTYSKQIYGIGLLDSAVVSSLEIKDKSEAMDLGVIRIYTDIN
jgi:hypothetical protein